MNEQEKLIADAERYRWLRDNAVILEFLVGKTERVARVFSFYGDFRRKEVLDEAIDKARAA